MSWVSISKQSVLFLIFLIFGILPLGVQWWIFNKSPHKEVEHHLSNLFDAFYLAQPTKKNTSSIAAQKQVVMPTWYIENNTIKNWSDHVWILEPKWMAFSDTAQLPVWTESNQGAGFLLQKKSNNLTIIQFIPVYSYFKNSNGVIAKKILSPFNTFGLRFSKNKENFSTTPLTYKSNVCAYMQPRLTLALPLWVIALNTLCTLGFFIVGFTYLHSFRRKLNHTIWYIALIIFISFCHFFAQGNHFLDFEKTFTQKNDLYAYRLIFLDGLMLSVIGAFAFPIPSPHGSLLIFRSKTLFRLLAQTSLLIIIYLILLAVKHLYEKFPITHLSLIFTEFSIDMLIFLALQILLGIFFFLTLHNFMLITEKKRWLALAFFVLGLAHFILADSNDSYTYATGFSLIATFLFVLLLRLQKWFHTLNRLRWESYLYILIGNILWSSIQTFYFRQYSYQKVEHAATQELTSIYNKYVTISSETLLSVGEELKQLGMLQKDWNYAYLPYELLYKRLEKRKLERITTPYIPQFYILHNGEIVYPQYRKHEAAKLQQLKYKILSRNAEVYSWRNKNTAPDELYLAVQNKERNQGVLILFKLMKVGSHQIRPDIGEYTDAQQLFYKSFFTTHYFEQYLRDTLISSGGTMVPDKSENWILPHVFSKSFEKDIRLDLYIDPIPAKFTLAHFSIFFLAVLLLVSAFLFSTAIYTKLKQTGTSFSTKIQFYIHTAFLLPLVVVCITAYSLVISDHKRYTEIQNREIMNTIQNAYNQHAADDEDNIKWLTSTSKLLQTDLHLYNLQGKLIYSSQNKIFEDHYLSTLINPTALKQIIFKNNPFFTDIEQIGNYTYKSIYFPLKDFKTGKHVGIVSVPFYESKMEQQKQTLLALASMFNIFVIVFIVLMLLGYVVSRNLTIPLIKLARSLAQISLSRQNAPLLYNEKDEIGLLVNEYNRMLIKLEENKKALQQTEKETAWKEMAKQVAHEIKNPLTPMKLTLQALQRRIEQKKLDQIELEKAIESLLEQIEILDEIAVSFSAFVQMPELQLTVFDICATVEHVAALHGQKENVTFEHRPMFVLGDEKLTHRILQNLYINAIQSVPYPKSPIVRTQVVKENEKVLVHIEDNGIGIPEAWKEKVFLPHFSSKENGTGLGLALAKKGMEQMRGAIHFVSDLNHGTVFTLTFQAALPGKTTVGIV